MWASFPIVILTTATCLHAITPPVAFEKNEGQAPREVAFLARVGGSRLFLGREGVEIAGIHLHLLGATPVDPVGRQILAAKSNYLTGADRSHWRTGIANYQEVWYARVYRGVDVRWHAQAGEIEQDFELAPGADPREIRIAISGASPAITAGGGLEAGNFRMRRPRAYQDGRAIACRFVLRRGTAAFVLGAYNRRRPLTIDPVLVFSTLIGGVSSSFSEARSVAIDSTGNIYVAGTTDAADFPVTANAYQANYNNVQCGSVFSNAECDDLFVSKFSGDGSTLLYSTYLGSAGYSGLMGMSIDPSGNVYLVGTVNLPNVNHAAGFPSLGSDPVVLKLSADGSSLLYATTVPLGASATVYALAADSAGAVYLTGYANADSGFPLVNAYQSTVSQPLVFKTTNSAQTWQGLANGLSGALVSSIAVDPENPKTVYLGLDEDLYKSTDGGSRWTAILQNVPAGAPYPEIDLLPTSIAIDPSNSQILYLGTGGNGIYKSTDGGSTWSSAWSGASRFVRMLAIDPANSKTLFAANDDGVYKSTDGAATWNATSLMATPANEQFYANSVVIDPSTPSTVYAGTTNGVSKSTDAGATWTAMTTGFTESTEITHLAIDPVNPQVLYASTIINFAPYRTSDGGAHWAQGAWAAQQGLLPYVNALLVDPLVHTTVWAVTDYSLRVSRDSGATWSAPPTDLPGYNVQALAAGTDGSIYAIANDFTSDAFVLKLDADGSTIDYSTYLGGSGPDAGNSIAVDAAGRAYIAGYTDSFDFPVANALQPRIGGLQDGFLAVLDPTGAKLLWSTYLGGSDDDGAWAVAVDGAGNVHLTGYTDSMDFPLRQAAQTQPAGVFAAKLKGDGSGLIFSTYFGGGGYGQAVAADGSGNTYVGGNTTGDSSAPGDVFVAAWNGETGAPLYATYLGGSKTDDFSSLAVDSGGNAYIAGSTNSPDFPRKYAYEYAFGAAYQDAFLAKIAPGTAGPSISLSGVANAASYTSTVSPGEIVSLFGKQLAVTPAEAAGAPLPVQLSDAQVSVSGTAAPLLYVSPRQINLQIPYETTAGTAQIRVTSGSGTATLNVPIRPAAPAIFTLNSLGNGAGAIEHALTGQLVTSANPAAAGEVVAVYCTGLGAVSPPVADGAAAPVPPAQAVMPVTAFIADAPAPVIFAGLAPGFAGLYQVNVQIPADTPSGVQNMAISVSGAASNTVTLAVH